MKINNKLAAKILLMLALGLSHSMSVTYAFPSQGTFDNSKAASIMASDNMMTITGKGKNNILNWANFQIGKNETVKFNDKNNYLNLVHGVDISRIYGTLSGGNIVYLVNPNGILFGQGTKLDNVGSFVASTRNISSINKEAFLQDPSNTVAVLGTDNPVMDNKDYYPEGSTYVPKISVAEMQLTNVPASATSIILDGPGGVILKNTELLDQAAQVTTRKNGGEIGIGSDNGTVVLTEVQKTKIALVDGDKAYAYEDSAGVLQGYQTVKDMDEFIAMDTVVRGEKAKNYMLVNDIDASDVVGYKTINGKGVFEGMGYYLSNLEVAESLDGMKGVFGYYSGDIRNFYIENVSFSKLGEVEYIGGLAGKLGGGSNVNNVHVSGNIEGNISGFFTAPHIGGMIGYARLSTVTSEIRNCGSNVSIKINSRAGLGSFPDYVGGIVGRIDGFGAESGMLCNLYNNGDISVDVEIQTVHLGGIIGGMYGGTGELEVKNVYNTGNLFSTHGGSLMTKQPINIGGVIGSIRKDNNVSIGDAYSFGCVSQVVKEWGGINLHTGGIIGRVYDGNTVYELVDMHDKTLKSYYIQNVGNCEYNTDFGEEKTPSEILDLFDKVMIGAYDFSKYNGDVTSGVPDVGEVVPPSEPDVPVNPNPDDPVVPKPDSPVEPKPDTPVIHPVNPGVNQDDFNEVIDDKEYNNLMNEVKDVKVIVNKNTYWDGSGFEPEIRYSVRDDAESSFEQMSWKDRITEGETVYRLEPNIQDDGYKELDGNMYMENWKTSAVDENGYCKVTFDVYNRESVSGVVEVYDANGNRINTVWINPFRKYAESIKETAYDIGKIFTGELDAKKTSIEVDVPVGGYFRITNNENNSPSLKLHTYIIDAIDNTEDFISMVRQIDDRILDILTEDRVKNVFADAIIEVIDDRLVEVALDKGVDYYTMGIYEVVDEVIKDVLSGEGRNLVFKAIADKFKQELNAKGIVEAIFWQFLDDAGQFTEPVREFLFSINMCLNELKEGAAKNNTEHARATNFIVGY